jgi:catechol 2,3-dioxygenase-like lactoylglutathione lyase family enzyme
VPSGIDHIVITVNDLDEASASFAALGFTVTFGGHHEHRPSSNALIPFADGSYIELVGFRPHPEPIIDPWWDLLQLGEGLVDFALRSDRVSLDLERVSIAGIPARGPISGGRARPDGQQIDWQVVRISSRERSTARAPFIIEDLTPRDLRIPSGSEAQHANGVDRTIGITVLVGSISEATTLYDAVIGHAGQPLSSDIDADAPAVRYLIGDQWIDIVEPRSPELVAVLNERGSGPVRFELGPAETASTIDLVVHGARLRVPTR